MQWNFSSLMAREFFILPARPSAAIFLCRERQTGMSAPRLRKTLRQLFLALLQQFEGRPDAVHLRQLAPLVLDADITVVVMLEHDLHHFEIVGLGFVPIGVEI